MNRQVLRTFFLMLLGIVAAPAMAQTLSQPNADAAATEAEEGSWYSDTSAQAQVTPRMIIQQKAQMRAYQRMARMESMKWYGMSASRPLASATPFAGIPSPRWEMPGGRPFAWTPYRTTNVVIVR